MKILTKTNLFIIALVLAIGATSAVFAQSSTNYQLEESFIGPGGTIESNSANYGIQGTIGDTGVGEADSSNYDNRAGFNTTNEPRLTFVVNTTSINFGIFSPSTTKTATSTFSVLNYTSSGYVVFVAGSPPVNDSYTLTGMSSTAPSSVGTEQFGLNLKANTSPATFGAEAVQVPSSDFAYGEAASNYNTANQYRYVSGETIARSTQASGQTDYTIAYIVNVANATPGGAYTTNHQLICIGTY